MFTGIQKHTHRLATEEKDGDGVLERYRQPPSRMHYFSSLFWHNVCMGLSWGLIGEADCPSATSTQGYKHPISVSCHSPSPGEKAAHFSEEEQSLSSISFSIPFFVILNLSLSDGREIFRPCWLDVEK